MDKVKKAKFSILSGAYVNAGDFLIVDRAIQLIKHVYKDCEIVVYKRKNDLTEYIEDINKTDALILAGGPAYMMNAYPDIIPLVADLDKIKTKIVSLGLGWYGKYTTDDYIYNDYKFTEKTKELLNRISKDSGFLTCRDWYSVKALKSNGFSNTIMTGCPAWYNIETIGKEKLREGINRSFKKICISDPAKSYHFEQAIELIKYLKEKYPQAEITCVFHRIEKENKLQEKVKNLGIKIENISNSAEGFKIYNNCDLHIGFRVHAHIYNLSMRNISILIEEDGRGTGANEALGSKGVKAYENRKRDSKLIRGIYKIVRKKYEKNNKYMIKNLDDILEELVQNDFIQYNTVFYNMNMYFKVMEDSIRKIIE